MMAVQLALTEKRKMQCDAYLFPEDYYDIPGVEEFGDFDKVNAYAVRQMLPYKNQDADIYINGGMSVLILAALQAGTALNLHLQILHYDSCRKIYIPQQFVWKPTAEKEEKEPVELTLCRGRHSGMPEQVIFERIEPEQMFDFSWQEEHAGHYLKPYRQRQVHIYLSGLTQLSISVLNAASQLGISVTFLHYNYDTEEYVQQKMNDFNL